MMMQTRTSIIHLLFYTIQFIFSPLMHLYTATLRRALSLLSLSRIFAVSVACPCSQSAWATTASPAPLPGRVVVGRRSHSSDHHIPPRYLRQRGSYPGGKCPVTAHAAGQRRACRQSVCMQQRRRGDVLLVSSRPVAPGRRPTVRAGRRRRRPCFPSRSYPYVHPPSAVVTRRHRTFRPRAPAPPENHHHRTHLPPRWG